MVDYNPFAKTFSQSRKNMKWPELDTILQDIQENNFKKIVDIGCGNGRFVEQYMSKFGELPSNYTGVDASEILVQEAKKTFPNQEFIVSTMQDFVSKLAKKIVDNVEDKFDAIVFLASFHHLETEQERIQVLSDCKKFLKKNWKIYLTNWNLLPQEKYKNSHTGNGDFQIKIWEFYRYYHWFSLEELEYIFHKSGFYIEKNEIFSWERNIFSILTHEIL